MKNPLLRKFVFYVTQNFSSFYKMIEDSLFPIIVTLNYYYN